MSNASFKRILLAGVAITTVGAFASGAYAQQININEDNSVDNSYEINGTATDVIADVAGHDIQLGGSAGTVTIQAADSGTIGNATPSAAPITAAVDAMTLVITNITPDDNEEVVTIDGNIVRGSGVNTLNLTINGAANADEPFTTVINGTADLGSGATVTVAGNGAPGDSIVALRTQGALTAGTINLDTNGNLARLVAGGSTDYTITANTIQGGTLGTPEGVVYVSGTGNVTFATEIGGNGSNAEGNAVNDIVIGTGAATTSSATFTDVIFSSGGITVGAGGAGTANAIFDTSGGNFTVVGAVDASTNATSNVRVNGSGVVTFSSALGNDQMDLVEVNGSAGVTFSSAYSTTFDVNSTGTVTHNDVVTATNYTVDGAGTIALSAAGNAVTNDIDLGANATVNFANGATLTTGGIDNVAGASPIGIVNFAGNSTIAGNIGATNKVNQLRVNGAGSTVNLDGTVNAQSVIYYASATVAASGATFATNVSTTGDNQGTLIFDNGGAVASTGQIGTSTGADLARINISGANTVVTQTGDIYANEIGLDNASAGLTLADGSDVFGSIVVTNAGIGDLTLQGAHVITGTIGEEAKDLDTLVINSNAKTVEFRGDVFVSTDGFTTAGATDARIFFRQGVQLDDDSPITAAEADTTTFAFEIDEDNSVANTPTVISAGAIELNNARVEAVVASDSGFVADGTVYTVFDGGGALVDPTNTTVIDNSLVLDFTWASTADGGNDGTITARRVNTPVSIATTSNNQGVGQVLEDLGTAGGQEIDDLQGNLAAATTVEEVDQLLESILPTVDGGSTVSAATTTTSNTMSLTTTRLASLRGSSETGVAAGNFNNGASMWFQGFGSTIEQDRVDNVAGYDADTYGFSVGADTAAIHDRSVWGLVFSYGNTDVDSEAGFGGTSDVDSYQLSAYVDYDIDDALYTTGVLGYGWNDIDQVRYNVGGTGLNASADYDSDQIFAYGEVGRTYRSGIFAFTPNVLANFVYLDTDDYTETGAGALNANVSSDEYYIFELGVGAEAAWLIENPDGSMFEPKFHAGARYDLADDEVETTSTFTGGGAAFTTSGADKDDWSFNVGAGFTAYSTSNWDFSASYDYEVADESDAHGGFVRAIYNF